MSGRQPCARCGGEEYVETLDGTDLLCPRCGGSGDEPRQASDD